MAPVLAAAAMLAAGAILALQAPINGRLSREVGRFPAALVSFTVGLLALVLVAGVVGQLGELGGVSEARWYWLTGGLIGAVYVTTALTVVAVIGSGGMTAGTVTGQLTASVIVDRLGLLGLEQVALSPERLLGVCLLALGAWLVVGERRLGELAEHTRAE